jgi:hypothetical protein
MFRMGQSEWVDLFPNGGSTTEVLLKYVVLVYFIVLVLCTT